MDLTGAGEASDKTVWATPTFAKRFRDPRLPASISERDIKALRFIGEGFEVAQYQLHIAVFGKVSETVVSRFVLRSAGQDLLRVERLNGMGINRLRLTPKGVQEVSTRISHDRSRFFAPGRWVAIKDLAHTLWINDLRVVFTMMAKPPDALLPAWSLQRAAGSAAAIPDLLAIWKGSRKAAGLVLACEVDLGSEPLKSTFLPKLHRLGETVRPEGGERAAVVVLTRGRQRAALLQDFGRSYPPTAELIVLELPAVPGRAALPELRLKLGIDSARVPL